MVYEYEEERLETRVVTAGSDHPVEVNGNVLDNPGSPGATCPPLTQSGPLGLDLLTGCNNVISVPNYQPRVTYYAEGTEAPGAADRYFLRVRRVSATGAAVTKPECDDPGTPSCQRIDFRPGWQTTLTTIPGEGIRGVRKEGFQLECINRNDSSPRDEVRMRMDFDTGYNGVDSGGAPPKPILRG